MPRVSNPRQWRRDASQGTIRRTDDTEGKFVTRGRVTKGMTSGWYGSVQVLKNGSVYLPATASPVDYLCFLAGRQGICPDITDFVGEQLDLLLWYIENSRMQRHGYSKSPEQAAVEWPHPDIARLEAHKAAPARIAPPQRVPPVGKDVMQLPYDDPTPCVVVPPLALATPDEESQ